ncbi:MATE family efflux transporter [Kordiimonas aestuarii]|uniref:hypothetical protein n=1 Tax=Kordiimonas aestuarii TaxID=1005925 RepID=UPI0021D04738|nr:hypothetical protein [Kordiimonas aestuarii]
MCEFLQISVKGANLGPGGLPLQIDFFARVESTCRRVHVEIRNSQNVPIFQSDIDASQNVGNNAGLQTRDLRASFDNAVAGLHCNDRVTVTLTCIDSAECTTTATTSVDCKGIDEPRCPQPGDVDIDLAFAGQAVDLAGNCIPSGDFTATATNVPPGSQIFWTLEIAGNPSVPPGVNPTTVHLPAGNEVISLTVTVIPQACPPVTRTVVFPDRHAGPCPNTVTYEIRKNGAVVAPPYENLESGEYTIRVLSPVGQQIRYTYVVEGVLVHAGPETEQSFQLQGMGDTTRVLVVADTSECCPPIPVAVDLTSAEGEAMTPEPEPEDPNPDLPDDQPDDGPGDGPGNGPGNGGNNGSNDDDDDWNWNFSLCGLLYAALMILVFAFIVAWVVAFSTFPPLVPVLLGLGIGLAAIIALQAIMSVTCNMSLCRALRILEWMFIWSAIACVLIALGSLLALQSLLFGALVGGVIALALALWLHARGCRQPELLRLP